MIHLRFDYIEAGLGCNENRHAQIVMKELGITYQIAVPQTICDQWWFFNCENVPEKLPSYLKPLGLTPEECIGHGLDKQDVELINNYKK